MADCQYRDADNIEARPESGAPYHLQDNYYRLSPGKLTEAVNEFNAVPLDFVIHLGDFIENDLNNADVLHPITAKLSAPFWHVLGNHDFDNSRGKMADILDKYKMRNNYYSQLVNGYRFIILDTNEIGVIEHPDDSPEWKAGRELLDTLIAQQAVNSFDWNGGLSQTQLEWLDNELAKAEEAGEKAVLFAHHPVFPPGNLVALNASDVLQIIDKHPNIVAFINGHHHCGGFGMRRNIPYLTLPGMIEGSKNAFGVVSVFDKKIEIKGYGRVQNMTFDLAR